MCIAIYLSEHPIAYRIPSRIPAIPDRIPYTIPYGTLWTHRIPYIRPSILYMPCICIIKYEEPVDCTTEKPPMHDTPCFPYAYHMDKDVSLQGQSCGACG